MANNRAQVPRTLLVGNFRDISALSPRPARHVSTVRAALATIRTENFEVIIVEQKLEDGDGMVLAPTIRRIQPHSISILISRREGWATVEAAQQLGFREVIGVDSSSFDINSLVEKLLLSRVSPEIPINNPPSAIHLLSVREREILMDLATGATTDEIARKRHNSTATIKSHLTSIYRKLGVRNRVEAIAQINSHQRAN